jgi:hypothetical protein
MLRRPGMRASPRKAIKSTLLTSQKLAQHHCDGIATIFGLVGVRR